MNKKEELKIINNLLKDNNKSTKAVITINNSHIKYRKDDVNMVFDKYAIIPLEMYQELLNKEN